MLAKLRRMPPSHVRMLPNSLGRGCLIVTFTGKQDFMQDEGCVTEIFRYKMRKVCYTLASSHQRNEGGERVSNSISVGMFDKSTSNEANFSQQTKDAKTQPQIKHSL
ncbi:hypothetical protein AJ81_06115 [Pseudothermotoga hypogea DSM 11164 = NBRC 106472]|uniref:Uncharacterized protein n=1 Tax=Pseudothermotoga hypogea DSM 11164 = NBRC 106472 TaxID=1123384 RepID=A0A0X1KU31_9THEM|nr:hypothetical protein AJ81_06115 [Pseudothermotoga hypogea DSM 11164 = NBRC 106472]